MLRSNNKQRNFLLLGSSLLIIFGAIYLISSSCTEVFAACHSSPQPVTQVSQELAPRYFTYSEAAVKTAHQQGKVVLYFWAPWCSTCTSLDLELQDGEKQVPEGVTILRVNYDTAVELKRKYNVVTQQTFIQLNAKDEAIKTWVGGELDNLAEQLN